MIAAVDSDLLKIALALGKAPAQFISDPDFAPYLKNKNFTALLEATEAKKALRADLLQSIDSGGARRL